MIPTYTNTFRENLTFPIMLDKKSFIRSSVSRECLSADFQNWILIFSHCATPSSVLTVYSILSINNWTSSSTFSCSVHSPLSLLLTRSSWLKSALRDEKVVCLVSIGQYDEAVAVGNWWYWVSRGHWCLYILHKVEIWTGVTDPLLTHS